MAQFCLVEFWGLPINLHLRSDCWWCVKMYRNVPNRDWYWVPGLSNNNAAHLSRQQTRALNKPSRRSKFLRITCTKDLYVGFPFSHLLTHDYKTSIFAMVPLKLYSKLQWWTQNTARVVTIIMVWLLLYYTIISQQSLLLTLGYHTHTHLQWCPFILIFINFPKNNESV